MIGRDQWIICPVCYVQFAAGFVETASQRHQPGTSGRAPKAMMRIFTLLHIPARDDCEVSSTGHASLQPPPVDASSQKQNVPDREYPSRGALHQSHLSLITVSLGLLLSTMTAVKRLFCYSKWNISILAHCPDVHLISFHVSLVFASSLSLI